MREVRAGENIAGPGEAAGVAQIGFEKGIRSRLRGGALTGNEPQC